MFKIISVIALISYFLPLLLVLLKRLWNDRFFVLFASYWAFGGLMNISDQIPSFPEDLNINLGILYNLVDIPFILCLLYFTSTSIIVRRFASAAILATVTTEIIGLATKGFSYDALKYSLGLGVAMVIVIAVWEIIRYLQKIEHSNRQNAKILVYAGLLFEYATFVVIYIFDYYVTSVNSRDSFLVYYMSSVVALIIASCGYLLFQKYEKQQRFSY